MYGQDLELVLTVGGIVWILLLTYWAVAHIWPEE